MVVHLLAGLLNGRTHNRAGYGRQRWCHGLQLAAVLADSAESQVGCMLRAALPQLIGRVPGPRWAKQSNDVTPS